MAASPAHGADDDLALVERLRAGGFDAALVFTTASQTPHPATMLAWLSGIPLRLAHADRKVYRLLTDAVPAAADAGSPGVEHEVARQLRLVASVGWAGDGDALRVTIPTRGWQAAARLCWELGIDARGPLVVVHPGASAPSRRYPASAYHAVVRTLAAEGWQLAVVGTGDERHLVEAVVGEERRGPGVHSVVGVLDVAGLAALLARATLFIGNNSGPSHLAAAVGTPIVSLYALTNLDHLPWRVASRVLSMPVPCAGCERSVCPLGHHLCLRGVPPSRVVEAARDLGAEGTADARTATIGAAARG